MFEECVGRLHIKHEAGEVEADNYDKVGEDENRALEIVALSFAVHVREEKDTENYSHHVPLREDKCWIQLITSLTFLWRRTY